MTKEEVISLLHKNYQGINEKMVAELNLASDHGGISGNFREKMWMDFFRNIVPKKFSLAQGVKIIDSNGNMSNEVDIAIFDEQYTPYVLQYGSLKFIPIEAVACVVECKSTNLKEIGLEKWSDNISKLRSNPTGIARMVTGNTIGLTNTTQQRTKPIKICVSLYHTVEEEKTDLDERLGKVFDIVIRPKGKEETKYFKIEIENEEKTLGWWSEYLNLDKDKKNNCEECNLISPKNGGKIADLYSSFYEKEKMENVSSDSKNSFKEKYLNLADNNLKNQLSDLRIQSKKTQEKNEILSLTFQLNQLLMLINNPMMFPHFAYAKTFNEIIR